MMLYMLNSIFKQLLIFSFIVSIVNTPICDINCNFPEYQQTTTHCQHHQPNSLEIITNNSTHSCDYLHENADNYLKYNISLYTKPFYYFYIPIKEKIQTVIIYIFPIIKTIPTFILYCVQLK